MSQPESALIIEVPAAEPFAGPWRARYDSSAAAGVPAHITVLYPFVRPDEIGPSAERTLGELAAASHAFDFVLDRVDAFPAVIWLAPHPAHPFRRLTQQVMRRFPGLLPYGGEFPDVPPHLTLAETDAVDHDALMSEVVARFRQEGTIAARADRLTLLVSDESRCWRPRARWEFLAP